MPQEPITSLPPMCGKKDRSLIPKPPIPPPPLPLCLPRITKGYGEFQGSSPSSLCAYVNINCSNTVHSEKDNKDFRYLGLFRIRG